MRLLRTRILISLFACIAACTTVCFATHANAQATAPEFDIDGDGICNASVDATLAARYLLGLRGEALIANVLPSNGGLTAQNVTTKLNALVASPALLLDINNDGAIDALNDGLLFTRHALGITDNTALTTGLKATPRGADAIKTYLASKCPPPPPSLFPWPVWTGVVPAVPPSTTGNTYYVDGTNGLNTNTGTTATTAFKTIAKGLTTIVAGDTLLIRKGLYRENVDLLLAGVPTGTALKPITIGSYGDGEVILDGSTKVGPWTRVGSTGTVWQATKTFNPVAVVVNDVPLKQVTQGQNGSTAPQVGLAGVTSSSGKWHNGATLITADMNGIDPNSADIVVPNDNGEQKHVYFYYQDYIRFRGLTIRGSGNAGIWGYGSHITIEDCDLKFNGKAGVSFQYENKPGAQFTDNSVLTSRVYHNVLTNWPRGNNNYAEAGGTWPGALGWAGNMRPLARGNLVYMNGGEGIITYGTSVGRPSGSALFEQNVAYDNWSVNMYFDNQPNDVARNNILFNHPIDYNPATTNFLYVGPEYPYNQLGKYAACLMLADEENSNDATSNYANLANSQVYNNLIAGCRIGIRDYSEGATTSQYHGMKNTLIANNTIIMPANPNAFPNTGGTFGIFLQDNTTPSGTNRNTGTTIANNIIIGYNNDPLVYSARTGAITGITLKNNLYFSPSAAPFGSGDNTVFSYNFAQWKTNVGAGQEVGSLFADPLLQNVAHFQTVGIAPYLYGNARPKAGPPTSPALGAGASQATTFTNNIELQTRSVWNIGAF
jgi:hypothetical protein